MPVPDVEELRPQLQGQLLLEFDVLDESHIVVVVTEGPQVRDARTHTRIEVEVIVVLEGALVEEGEVGIEVALTLRPRVGPRQDTREATLRKLARDIAVTGPEEQGDSRRNSQDAADGPPSQEAVDESG